MAVVDAVSWLENLRIDNAVLIVLNQPIVRRDLFKRAWAACARVAVTDGAANHLAALGSHYVPDLIVGDFDSILPESREVFERARVAFVSDPDQNATDFMKAMKHSHARFDAPDRPISTFLAFGALGGRVDHTWHSYLCMWLAHQRGDRLILVSTQSVTFLVDAGEHEVRTPLKYVGLTCGYAPIEGVATVTTRGLNWDVEDYPVSFTTQLSTSNQLTADEIYVKTDKPLMITLELR